MMDKRYIQAARKLIYTDGRNYIQAMAVRLVSCAIEAGSGSSPAGWSAKGACANEAIGEMDKEDILSNCSDLRFAETVFRRLPLSEILRVIDIIKYRLVQ